jgi:hypothetical protein
MINFSRSMRCALNASAVAVIVALAISQNARAQQGFASPEAAIDALVTAVRGGDPQAMMTVLGRAGADIVSSGDAVDDAATRDRFLKAYDAKHQITMDGDRKAIVNVGQDDFPFPIPLVRDDKVWRFDTAAGRLEILYRRIGRNELDAIQTCLSYVDAQNEYAEKDRTGTGAGVYAQRFFSRSGKKDGLYWPAAQGGDESPLGELFAEASADGYRVSGWRRPFHGYYYKILTSQGPNAGGGELDYVVRGRMIGGFALIAFPSDYGKTGVMTFMVNHGGTIYQKDLGPRTAQIADRIRWFNPDQTWKKVDVTLPQR